MGLNPAASSRSFADRTAWKAASLSASARHIVYSSAREGRTSGRSVQELYKVLRPLQSCFAGHAGGSSEMCDDLRASGS